MRLKWSWTAILLAAAASACATTTEQAVSRTAASEDVYVVRTVRASTVAGAAPECAAAPFPTRGYDVYDLRSVDVAADTALIAAPSGPTVGGFNACLGEFRQDGTFDMFSFGELNGSAWSALAHCTIVAAREPVEEAALLHCTARIEDPPAGYVDGLLISNTMTPRGSALDVPGYVTTSVIVMRLWRAAGA